VTVIRTFPLLLPLLKRSKFEIPPAIVVFATFFIGEILFIAYETLMISLTNVAHASLVSLLNRKNADGNTGLRLDVKKGGCAGLQYAMEVEPKQEGDLLAGDDQARVFVAPEAAQYLQGMTLDYSISLADSGFKIINPNAARSCGCGTSFEPKSDADTSQLEEGDACESEQNTN